MRELLDFVRLEPLRLERLERFVRLEPRRLAPPVAGGVAGIPGGAGIAGGAGGGAGVAGGAGAAAAVPNPKRFFTEFNSVPFPPLDISTLAQ